MESTGARLKKIRLEKGISLEEAHKKTKIHRNILKAVEEDSLVNLSPVYSKGFIKIYCKFLGVNPADFIHDYKEPASRSKLEPHPAAHKKSEPLIERMVFKFDAFKLRLTPKTIVMSIVIIIFIIFLFKLPKIISSARVYLSSKRAVVSSVILPTKTGKEVLSPVSSAQKIPASTVIRLGIRVKDNCLVKVKADGHLLIDRIFRKGMSDSWTAKEKIELSLGNAGVAELEINGKRIAALGRKGQTIKNIVITKDGWSIPR